MVSPLILSRTCSTDCWFETLNKKLTKILQKVNRKANTLASLFSTSFKRNWDDGYEEATSALFQFPGNAEQRALKWYPVFLYILQVSQTAIWLFSWNDESITILAFVWCLSLEMTDRQTDKTDRQTDRQAVAGLWVLLRVICFEIHLKMFQVHSNGSCSSAYWCTIIVYKGNKWVCVCVRVCLWQIL